MKSFTSVEQSRKLAEILPLETADMYWDYDVQKHEDYPMVMDDQFDDTCICAWSLAALLSVMICPNLEEYIEGVWNLTTFTDESLKTPIEIQDYENPTDACVEMIIKLHELNLL